MKADLRLLLGRQFRKTFLLRAWLGTGLKSDRPGYTLPFRKSPSRGHWRFQQKGSRGLFARFFCAWVIDSAQFRRGFQDSTFSFVGEYFCDLSRPQLAPNSQCQSRYHEVSAGFCYHRGARGSDPRPSVLLPVISRKRGQPRVPDTHRAQRHLSVGLNIFLSFGRDPFLPILIVADCFLTGLFKDLCKHIKVMDIAQHILYALQGFAELRVNIWQQTFNTVSKALYSNSQRVPRPVALGPHCAAVQFFRFFQALQCKAVSSIAIRRDAAHACAQRSRQFLPPRF